jgi:hypothetical protein
MRRITKTAAAAAVATGALLSFGVTEAQAATIHGCPSGYVCVYPENAGWNGDRPSLKYYTYGAHNLSNQFGYHYVFNNQTDYAISRFCLKYDGRDCGWTLFAGNYTNFDLTPINSIYLAP